MGRACSLIGRSFQNFSGQTYRKETLGRPQSKWEDNIRMDLKEIGVTRNNWIGSGQDGDFWRSLVNAAFNFRISISHGVS
jgi:hypothetical protein